MSVYKRADKWYIDYYLPGGKRIREAAGSSKKLAEKLLAKRQAEVLKGKFNVNRKDPVLFSEFAKEFLAFCKASKKKNTHRFHFNNLKSLLKEFDEKYIGNITPYDIEQYKIRRLGEVSASTVNRELATLSHMFETGIDWGKLDGNPVKAVKKLKEPPGKIKYFSIEEINNLVDNCNVSYLRIAILIAVNTGMRKGEILSLKRSDIDLEHRIISIEESKSGKRRDIPVNNVLFEHLKEWMNGSEIEEVIPIGDFKRSYETACRKAGLDDITFHTLRHTFASHLVMEGIDLATVKELMGHATIQMTMRYAHLSPDHRRAAVNRLAEKYRSGSSQTLSA